MRCVVNHCFHRSKLTIRFARGGHSEFGKNLPKGKMQWRADKKSRTQMVEQIREQQGARSRTVGEGGIRSLWPKASRRPNDRRSPAIAY